MDIQHNNEMIINSTTMNVNEQMCSELSATKRICITHIILLFYVCTGTSVANTIENISNGFQIQSLFVMDRDHRMNKKQMLWSHVQILLELPTKAPAMKSIKTMSTTTMDDIIVRMEKDLQYHSAEHGKSIPVMQKQKKLKPTLTKTVHAF